jgi:uncharacterized protein YdhG (YjbR/CyaY superfamily)
MRLEGIVMKETSKTKSVVHKDVDEYLADVPDIPRATLKKLRKTIKAAAPKATEGISYRIPVYKHLGMLVGFAAFTNHCSFFVMSYAVLRAHREELKQYDLDKGTIRFPLDKPLPAALVRKMVKARVAENEAKRE